MHTKKKENKYNVSLKKKSFPKKKLAEDNIEWYEPNLQNIFNQNDSINNTEKIENDYLLKEEEDDYNDSLYDIALSKDKNFLKDIILNNETISKSLNFNNKFFFSEKKKFGMNSVNFNENIFSSINDEEKNFSDDINYLIKNIQLFTKMNKERKKNYMIDLQYNNYFFNSIDNGSPKINHRIISRFSKDYSKNITQKETSTIPVLHSRFASQPFNGPYLGKNKILKNNLNHTINLNLNDDNLNSKSNFLQYNTNDNTKIKNKNMNRILDLTNLYEENKMNGNSLINLKYFNLEKIENKKLGQNTEEKMPMPRLEEEYAFDSSGNQKFLCIKRFGENNKELINNSNISLNKNIRNIHDKDLKEIVIKNINMKYPSRILKKSKSRKNNNSKIIERFAFYSPQISYKNVFSPNKKKYVGKLYKKSSDKINGNNQHYISLMKEKVNKNNVKININNKLKNSKSCVFKYWPNKVNNKNIKNSGNNNNSYNLKFLNSFNKVINSENNNSNIKSNNDINGSENYLIKNKNSRNSYYVNRLDNPHINLNSFSNYLNDNNLYNSVRNKNDLINLSNNENNKIFFPLNNFENVKVDYSNKNNYTYHEIKMSKDKVNKKINLKNKNGIKTKVDKNKIINLTNMDNIKILKKYNISHRMKKDFTKKN